jgi:multiple antibiotic resistance protein
MEEVSARVLAAFVALFVVVDPIATAPLFASLTGAHAPAERARIARRAVVVAASVLGVFALTGAWLLGLLGIELASFRIAGGLLLFLLSVDMIMVRQTGLRATTPGEDREARERADVSVFPLAIPLIAGPGAMTTVVLLMGAARGSLARQAEVLLVLACVLLLTLACLLGAGRLARFLGLTGTNVVTRVSGLFTAALAVQFVLDGLDEAFSA